MTTERSGKFTERNVALEITVLNFTLKKKKWLKGKSRMHDDGDKSQHNHTSTQLAVGGENRPALVCRHLSTTAS